MKRQRVIGCFEDGRPNKNNKKNNNKTSSDMGSVPGPKTVFRALVGATIFKTAYNSLSFHIGSG